MKTQITPSEKRFLANESVLSLVASSHEATPESGTVSARGGVTRYFRAFSSENIDTINAFSTGSYVVVWTETSDEKRWIAATPLQTKQVTSLSAQFETFLLKWEENTEYTSSITKIVLNEFYQRIIGMGPAVVPLSKTT
jgi:hypothetical protein